MLVVSYLRILSKPKAMESRLPCFLLKASAFTLRSLIYFELVSAYGTRYTSNLIVLHATTHLLQPHLLKKIISLLRALGTFVKSQLIRDA